MRKPPLRNWTGNADTNDPLITEAAPPAKVDLLRAADNFPIAAAMSYACPALIYNGHDTTDTNGLSTEARRFWLVTGPAVKHARAIVTRCGVTSTTSVAQQTATTIDTTTTSTVGSYTTSTVEFNATIAGPVQMGDFGTDPGIIKTIVSGDEINASPSAAISRQLHLQEATKPKLEEFEVAYSVGFGLVPTVRSGDLESI